MDVMLFVKIVCWVVAIIGTLIASLSAWYMWWYHCTPAGKIEQFADMMKGRTQVFRWSPLLLAILAWIAIFCFR